MLPRFDDEEVGETVQTTDLVVRSMRFRPGDDVRCQAQGYLRALAGGVCRRPRSGSGCTGRELPCGAQLREKLPALLVEIVGPGKNALVFDPGEAVPALKGHLTDEIIENLGTCTALHGALLANSSGAVLLCGSPGSGKTTLAFAMMQRGFQSHADGAITGEKRSSVRGRALRERHFFLGSISSDIL